jgi:cytochrome c-type biogenesis protein CcmE
MSIERNRRRLFILAAVVVAVATLAYLASGGIGENLVYYWSPSELQEAGDEAIGASIRLGGLVAPGSVERAADGLTLSFDVSDGMAQVPVYASSVPPAMFREGIGVVVEGTMRDDGIFETRRLMVKHDNEYKAPEDVNNPDMKKMMETMQFEGSES